MCIRYKGKNQKNLETPDKKVVQSREAGKLIAGALGWFLIPQRKRQVLPFSL